MTQWIKKENNCESCFFLLSHATTPFTRFLQAKKTSLPSFNSHRSSQRQQFLISEFTLDFLKQYWYPENIFVCKRITLKICDYMFTYNSTLLTSPLPGWLETASMFQNLPRISEPAPSEMPRQYQHRVPREEEDDPVCWQGFLLYSQLNKMSVVVT